MHIHLVFDVLAASCSLLVTGVVYHFRIEHTDLDPTRALNFGYVMALVAGAVTGGYGFGTLNLYLSGVPGLGRSILGALAGAIFAIEVYKYLKGVRGSTGIIFVVGFVTTVAVGRIGCLLSGIEDQTYGIPTGAGWGWDLGDGILRHPVALYESFAMTAFLIVILVAFKIRSRFVLQNGFYLLVGFYATQRFIWEFLKPYAKVAGSMNLFHVICILLIIYALFMIVRHRHVRA